MSKTIHQFYKKIKEINISKSAASVAFFLILSFVPGLLMMMQLANFFGIEFVLYTQVLERIFPEEIFDFVMYSISHGSSVSDFSNVFFVIIAMFGLSKVLLELSHINHEIYHVKKRHSRFIDRLIALFLVFFLYFLIALYFFVVMILGNYYMLDYVDVPFAKRIYVIFYLFMILVFPIFTMAMIYKIVTPVKIYFKTAFISGFITTVFWLIITYLFTIYVKNIANYSVFYGVFSFVIIFIYWLFLMSSTLLVGMVITYYVHERFTR